MALLRRGLSKWRPDGLGVRVEIRLVGVEGEEAVSPGEFWRKAFQNK